MDKSASMNVQDGAKNSIVTYTLTPPTPSQQTMDNTIDGRCFKCQQLWEDTNHVL
jgi:hypothetical protein